MEKLELSYIAATASLENSLQFLKILTELPYDPAVLLLGIYPREMKIRITQKLVNNCLQQHY